MWRRTSRVFQLFTTVFAVLAATLVAGVALGAAQQPAAWSVNSSIAAVPDGWDALA